MESRRRERHPWHSSPHREGDYPYYHLTAACFEHRNVIGTTVERMSAFEETLLNTLNQHGKQVVAWCVLPNHYHALVESEEILAVLKDVGQMHGRTSFTWNGEDGQRGRQVWFNCIERAMRTERHLWVTVNYIHHNPVHHGYVKRWQDWPFSSAASFLEKVGREKAERIWKTYPILEYGKGWDDPNL